MKTPQAQSCRKNVIQASYITLFNPGIFPELKPERLFPWTTSEQQRICTTQRTFFPIRQCLPTKRKGLLDDSRSPFKKWLKPFCSSPFSIVFSSTHTEFCRRAGKIFCVTRARKCSLQGDFSLFLRSNMTIYGSVGRFDQCFSLSPLLCNRQNAWVTRERKDR